MKNAGPGAFGYYCIWLRATPSRGPAHVLVARAFCGGYAIDCGVCMRVWNGMVGTQVGMHVDSISLFVGRRRLYIGFGGIATQARSQVAKHPFHAPRGYHPVRFLA